MRELGDLLAALKWDAPSTAVSDDCNKGGRPPAWSDRQLGAWDRRIATDHLLAKKKHGQRAESLRSIARDIAASDPERLQASAKKDKSIAILAKRIDSKICAYRKRNPIGNLFN